jgi:hypothetical protein
MKTKITVVTGLALALLVPTVAGAKPTPNAGDKRAAKSECSMFRGHSHATREAFQAKFTTFRACVKQKAAEEAQEAQNAHTNAAKECKAARTENPSQFMADWGTPGQNGANRNGKNAFGKCVSSTAKAKEKKADAKDEQDATEFKNAAKECANERSEDAEGFKTTYGTEGSNWKNAFGKCVSQKVREEDEQPETTQPTS